jgi:hypothetical protein
MEIGYPMEWIDVVMTSITSVRTNVKWNGERAEYFHPQRGIRQGDPISPYLFVICMDKLSHLITQAVHETKWKPMRAGRNGPLISHLMFADDLILFAEANVDQMNVVLNIIDQFCQLSGQKVSQEKTSIMFSKNVCPRVKEALVMMSGFTEATSLGKYLGVPLVGRAPKRSDYNYIINQVKTKLSAWKAKHLSFAGRVTLSKAVIEAIPVYPMMTVAIPKACLNELQKIQRAFIWGDDNSGRKYHAVSWGNVTLPKVYGGLGMRRLVQMNKACLMKLGWAIRSGKEALWIEVIKGKYDRQNTNFEHVVVKAQDSSLWKSLVQTWHYFDLYEYWNIGKGDSVRAWSDKWLFTGTSIEDMGIMVPDNMQSMMVKDLVDDNGCWKFDLLNTWLPHNIISKLYAILPPPSDGDIDRRVWSGTDNGQFSIASAYNLLCSLGDHNREMGWVRIWKLKVPERIRSFIWLVRHDRLITNYRKSKMHIGEPWCTHCVDIIEDTLHVLRDCPLAKSVWCNLLNNDAREFFFAVELKDWIHMILQQELGRNMYMDWSGVWATSCHFLWTWRNRETRDDTRLRPIQPW